MGGRQRPAFIDAPKRKKPATNMFMIIVYCLAAFAAIQVVIALLLTVLFLVFGPAAMRNLKNG